MTRAYCSDCGVELGADPTVVIPLCPDCRVKATVAVAEQVWMVRRRGERPQGPFKREIVVEWIDRDLLDIHDELSRPGAAWRTVASVPEFQSWFTPGDSDFLRRLDTADKKARKLKAEIRSNLLRRIFSLVGIVVFSGLPIITWKTRLTEFPDSWLASIQQKATSASQRLSSTLRHAANEDEALRVSAAMGQLPGDDFIDALLETWEAPREAPPAIVHLLKGRTLVLQATPDGDLEARREFESALALAPGDVRCLTALVEFYAAASERQPKLLRDAITLLARADVLAPGSRDVLQARAAVSLANQPSVARQAAERCLEVDPGNLMCRYYEGMAYLDMDQPDAGLVSLRAVIEAAPHPPLFQLGYGEAAVAAGSLHEAKRIISAFIRSQPQVAAGHALAAHMAWLTADWHNAVREARRALSLDPTLVETRVMAAELVMTLERPSAALELIEPLLADPPEECAVLHRAYLLASAVYRAEGQQAEAQQMARKALEVRPDWPPASIALALSFRQEADLKSAENALKDGDPDELDPVDAGGFYTVQARIYQEQGRDKAALETFEAALRKDFHSAEARLGLARTYLRLNNLSKAVDELRSIAPTNFEQADTHPPYKLCPVPPSPLGELLVSFRKAIANDLRLTHTLPVVEGIIAYHAGDLIAAETMLRQALLEDEADDAARAYLARITMRRGNLVEARTILDRLVSTQGKEGLYCAWFGLTLARLGEHRKAGLIFDRAFQAAENWPGLRRYHAEALFLAGKKEEALAEAANVWQLDPADHQVRRLVMVKSGE